MGFCSFDGRTFGLMIADCGESKEHNSGCERTTMNIRVKSSMSSDAVSPVQKTISERIKIARTLCIFFMTFVHIPPGIHESTPDEDISAFDIIYFVFTRMVGLSSVSLLSVVSGYFIVSSLLKAGTQQLIVSKVKTLVVPLVAWNALLLILYAAYGLLSGNWQNWPEASPMAIANAFLAVSDWPLDIPLWFLRDLFVCCLFSPLLYWGLCRFPAFVMLVLIAFALFGEGLYILQRPQLILFFGLGMWLRVAGAEEGRIDRAARLLAVVLIAMAAIFLAIRIERIAFSEMNDQLLQTLDTLLRLTMAAAFWWLTGLIRRSPLAGPFMRFEPYTFFLFCSHAIFFFFAAIPFRWVFGNYGSDLFPITFFTLPFLAMIAAIIGLGIANRSRLLLFLFNAGRALPIPPGTPREPSARSSANRNLRQP